MQLEKGKEIQSSEVCTNSMFNILRTSPQTVFHGSCTILHSQQQRMKVPIFPHPRQHVTFLFFCFRFLAILVGVKW